MSLKFGEIKNDKKSKNLLIENRLIKNKVVVPDEFEFEEGNKYYIGCKDGEFV